MLILTRKPSQIIFIGDDIKIQVLDAGRNAVRLGIDAPKHIDVYREELYRRYQQEQGASEKFSSWG